jgi:AcrR family transcriptional regulator
MKETRELVIRTARKMFAKKGVTETTMDDIAKEAKIGKGTIYHYFDSKEELYCVILDIDFAEAKAELEKWFRSRPSRIKKLRLISTPG